MDISPYVERLREELTAVTAGGTPEVRDAAERLARALDPAVRLTLFGVLADAAAEVTAALPAGSVTARLSGRDIDFVIDGFPDGFGPGGFGPSGHGSGGLDHAADLTSHLGGPGTAHPASSGPGPSAPGSAGAATVRPDPAETEEGDLARITVRLPEGVKERAERLAGNASQSLNSWIVNTLRSATRTGGVDIDLDLTGLPFSVPRPPDFPPGFPAPPPGGSRSRGRMTGWV